MTAPTDLEITRTVEEALDRGSLDSHTREAFWVALDRAIVALWDSNDFRPLTERTRFDAILEAGADEFERLAEPILARVLRDTLGRVAAEMPDVPRRRTLAA